MSINSFAFFLRRAKTIDKRCEIHFECNCVPRQIRASFLRDNVGTREDLDPRGYRYTVKNSANIRVLIREISRPFKSRGTRGCLHLDYVFIGLCERERDPFPLSRGSHDNPSSRYPRYIEASADPYYENWFVKSGRKASIYAKYYC